MSAAAAAAAIATTGGIAWHLFNVLWRIYAMQEL
jgi:hypothetical protein